jgi:hypothetical protein
MNMIPDDQEDKKEKRKKMLKTARNIYVSGAAVAAVIGFIMTRNILLSLAYGLLSWIYVIFTVLRLFGM